MSTAWSVQAHDIISPYRKLYISFNVTSENMVAHQYKISWLIISFFYYLSACQCIDFVKRI